MMSTLEAVRDALVSLPGVASCRIGIEANIAASDWPMVRLVPSRILPGRPYANRTVDLLVYVGDDTTNSEGLEDVYANVLALEGQVLDVVLRAGHKYIETLTDEDRFSAAYKLMVLRFEVVGLTHATATTDLACSYRVGDP